MNSETFFQINTKNLKEIDATYEQILSLGAKASAKGLSDGAFVHFERIFRELHRQLGWPLQH